MSLLTDARDHARRMSTAAHRDDCHVEVPSKFVSGLTERVHPAPDCGGCVTDREREQWRLQADEIDEYLAGPEDDALFFVTPVCRCGEPATVHEPTTPDGSDPEPMCTSCADGVRECLDGEQRQREEEWSR